MRKVGFMEGGETRGPTHRALIINKERVRRGGGGKGGRLELPLPASSFQYELLFYFIIVYLLQRNGLKTIYLIIIYFLRIQQGPSNNIET
jgi:hypothetical protein